MEHTKEYIKINKVLTRLEAGQYAVANIHWCTDRVDWAWRWRKITKDEMEELASRCIALLDRGG